MMCNLTLKSYKILESRAQRLTNSRISTKIMSGKHEAPAAVQRSQGFSQTSTPAPTTVKGVPMSRPTRKYEGVKACADADPELFFPADKPSKLAPRERRTYDQQVKEAKAHCAVCPVTTECLQTAFLLHAEFGIWGGTTAEERRRRLDADAAHAKQGQGILADFGPRAALAVAR